MRVIDLPAQTARIRTVTVEYYATFVAVIQFSKLFCS